MLHGDLHRLLGTSHDTWVACGFLSGASFAAVIILARLAEVKPRVCASLDAVLHGAGVIMA
jgi:cyanate permease